MKKDDEKLLIDIPKWDKHQRELKQSGKRQREWIAMSTRIAHDPNFFNLTIEARYLWMMLLCHAGAVGVPMKLSASDARVMFKLRRNADFSPLINQGFITLLQDKTRQDKTGQDSCADAPTPIKKAVAKVPEKTEPAEQEIYPAGLNVQAWVEWLAYRKSARLPKYKTTKQMDNLAKYPMDVQAKSVESSITQGYQGVFPEKFFSTKSEKQMQTNINAMQEFLNG